VVAGLFGFPASIGDPRIANRFVFIACLGWFAAAAPGENRYVC
jgi:hypothetical protein